MNYSRQNVLGLQLRAMVNLPKLTRAELWNRLQLVKTIEPLVDKAFKISEEKIHEQQLDDAPHGQPWSVSFHGSQFPGNNPLACPRASLYRMMDFPASAPMSRKLRQTADMGKAFETTLVNAWWMSGMLLSSSDAQKQTGFEYPEAWLTSSVDAVIRIGHMPVPIEVKQRYHEIVQQMQLGVRGPFPEHVSQNGVQVALIRCAQRDGLLWPLSDGWDLCTHGVIYYGSRDDPDGTTAEFRVDHNENFFVAGIEKLKRWRTYFEEDHLPEINPGKRSSKFGHPNGWRWSQPPCVYCDFKKTCQLDFREGNTQLSNSIGVDRAKKIRPSYDVESARLRVRARWQRKDRDSPHQDQSQKAEG